MSGYTKLFSNILDSTIWGESKETRLVWITMLAMKNGDQVVEASIPGLARRAGVSSDECEQSLKRLLAPDPYSRTKEHEGRRIKAVDGGWLILNGAAYRNRMSKDERREYKRIKAAEYRQNKKLLTGEASHAALEANGATQAELDRHSDSTLPTTVKPYS